MYALTITFLRTYLREVKGLAHTVVCQTSFFVAKAGSKLSIYQYCKVLAVTVTPTLGIITAPWKTIEHSNY